MPALPSRRTTQYFEMLGNRAIYNDGWVGGDDAGDAALGTEHRAAAGPAHRLQVGALQRREDPTESNDLAAQMPDKLKELQDLFYAEARQARRAAARQLDAGALERAAPEPDRRAHGVHLLGHADRRPQQRRAEHPRTSRRPSPPRSTIPRAARKA